MADSFECPGCGKSYPRESRLVGKAVACDCGRRFLVPAPAAPASASPPPLAKPVTAAQPVKPALAARPAQPARLPGINTPLKTASPPQAKPARWADPIPQAAPADASQEVIPLTEADLVDDGAAPRAATPLGPPPAVALYPAQLAPVAPPQPTLPRARYKPPEVKKPKKRKADSNRDASATMGRWVAMFVFFGVLPLAGLLFLLMLISYSRHGWQAPSPRRLGEVHRQEASSRLCESATHGHARSGIRENSVDNARIAVILTKSTSECSRIPLQMSQNHVRPSSLAACAWPGPANRRDCAPC